MANKTLSKITVLATILVSPNLIYGLFGMNVPVPGRSTTGLEWFFGIVGVICAIAIWLRHYCKEAQGHLGQGHSINRRTTSKILSQQSILSRSLAYMVTCQ
jgi:hypothetical protein